MSVLQRLTAALMAGLMAAAFLPATSASAACYTPNSTEKAFARKMNNARSNADKGSLRLDPELSKAAKVHTREMIKKDLLHHTPSETLRRRVTNWSILGENVGVGGTVTSLHQAFMNSTAHRANILLSDFRHVGVGAIKDDGRLWVTVIFEARSDPGSPLC